MTAPTWLRRLWNDRNWLPMASGLTGFAAVDLDGMSAHVRSTNLPGVTAPGTRPVAASVRGGAPNHRKAVS